MDPIIKSSLLIPSALFVLHAGLSECRAQTPAEAVQTNPPAFRTSLRSEEVIGTQAIQRAYVKFATNEFAFVVPDGYRMDASIPEKITLIKNDYTCSISVVFNRGQVGTDSLQASAFRQTVLERYPAAQIRDEFAQSAANHSGPAFDLQIPNGSGGVQCARVVFVPFPAGIVEFTLLAHPDHLTAGRYAFDSLLLSFCSNQDGKLTITPLAAES